MSGIKSGLSVIFITGLLAASAVAVTAQDAGPVEDYVPHGFIIDGDMPPVPDNASTL